MKRYYLVTLACPDYTCRTKEKIIVEVGKDIIPVAEYASSIGRCYNVTSIIEISEEEYNN